MANSILDNLVYKSDKPMFSTSFTPEMLHGNNKLTHRQLETMSATETANQLFNKKDTGLSDISDFMKNIAMAESNIGKGVSPVSYSPFQIDPIRYEDLQFRARGDKGYTQKQSKGTLDRANLANSLLKAMGYGENFDILNLSNEQRRDPNIGALLTRMMLANIPKGVPKDLSGQADYWKKYWNTEAENAKGSTRHFINQAQTYNRSLNIKTYDNTPIK